MDPVVFEAWEAVIGLEVHVELNTRSKLFSPAPNRFGDEPNTNITDICTGHPGTLPVLNREAVYKAVRFGSAIQAQIARYSRFDRKSYFYPDSPRNFQITQFEMPLILGGRLTADVHGGAKTFAITKTHLEDDAGMLKHFTHFAGVDYNRAGVPLIEIVSDPCIFSSHEAVAYATGLKAILEYLDVSDCNMEQGSLRIDANISVRPKGESNLRNKIQIKNLNSFTFMAAALESEFKRQVREYVTHRDRPPHEVIRQATYRWDQDKNMTVLMREKERAEDYRYFIEPDLPPLILEEEYISSILASLPELPYEKEKRYIQDYGIFHESAAILVSEKPLADYFEKALPFCANPKGLCNWIITEFAGRLKEKGIKIWDSQIRPEDVGELVQMIDAGQITGKIAKEVADRMVAKPGVAPETIVAENPELAPLADIQKLEAIIDQVLSEHAQTVADYKAGKKLAFGYLVGQVMKATQGKAPPPLVNRILNEKIELL
jgi:aspartyl-tRNA(Asn)/glutamyl-tRNA(Gln) amidotransferase subunit B